MCQQFCIRGNREMDVDLFPFVAVQGFEAAFKIIGACLVV